MPSKSETRQLHSGEYFGESRDSWWDHDFVAFLFKKWQLGHCRYVLDVGCGVGHWGRVVLPHLPKEAGLVGVDRESEWVKQATARAQAAGIGHRARYVSGDAAKLPFADNEFELVTCQTVLIHVPDCRKVIAEMIRVLKPGGCLLVAEPNNLAASQIVGNVRFLEPVEQRLVMTRFQLVCERGKAALGEGNNSAGELVPGLFSDAGLDNVRVCQSSMAAPLLPPYLTAAEQALRGEILDWAGRDFWIWSRDDTRRYFVAGGGKSEEFEAMWKLAMGLARADADALRNNTYSSAGGGVAYLVVGVKPAAR